MPSGIAGNLAWEMPLPSDGNFSVKANSNGIVFADGSGYDTATDTTTIKSPQATFKVMLRRTDWTRLWRGEWETVADIKNGKGTTRGDLKIEITGARNG